MVKQQIQTSPYDSLANIHELKLVLVLILSVPCNDNVKHYNGYS